MSENLVKCYHVSHIKNRQSILRMGLLPMDSKIMNYTKKLFFSIDRNILGFDYAGYTNVDIWSFFLSKDKIEKDKNAWNECFYCASEKIPVEKLKLEETLHEY